MNNQYFIQQMIKINQLKKSKNKLERNMYKAYEKDFIEEYFYDINKECVHEEYEHSAYFLDTELKECVEEIAGFRLITCQTCHKQIWLPKTRDPNWNIKIGNRIINVEEKVKIKCKR